MTSSPQITLSEKFSPIGHGRGYHPFLRTLANQSGVYVIFANNDNGKPLYVGESHTNRLYDTITRHFRSWRIDPRNDAQGRRRGGTTYDRARVTLSVAITAPQDAAAAQFALIQVLNPRDNGTDGRTLIADDNDTAGGMPV